MEKILKTFYYNSFAKLMEFFFNLKLLPLLYKIFSIEAFEDYPTTS